MKHSTISAAILLASVFCEVHAQSEWVVRFNDGSEKAFDIESIKEMYPRNKTAEMNSKVRIAIFETISGYSVRNVMFYDAAANITPNATLFATTDNGSFSIDFGQMNYTAAEYMKWQVPNFLVEPPMPHHLPAMLRKTITPYAFLTKRKVQTSPFA